MNARPTPHGDCPDDMELAAYLDRSLSPAAAASVEAHVAECGRCAAVLVESSVNLDVLHGRQRPAFNRAAVFAALATAAALVLAAGAYFFVSRGGSRDRVQQAYAGFIEVHRGSRFVEPRVSGVQVHTPFRLQRGADPARSEAAVSPDVRQAAHAVEEAVRGRSDAAALTAWGKTQLLLGQLDAAIATLTSAVNAERGGAVGDLGAAYIARGIQRNHEADIRRGLELTDETLASGASGVELRFNRALALERLGRHSEAIEAWRAYIDAEPNPDWRREAEDHLARLSPPRLSRDNIAPRTSRQYSWRRVQC